MLTTKQKCKFTIVIPTRDRPQFVRESLKHISNSNYKNIEVIVSDNCSSEKTSCREEVAKSNIEGVIYLRPEHQLSMIDNWNFPLSHVTGDYILYLTDKMILLPNTLALANEAANDTSADLISWADDIFTPDTWNDYFGPGHYHVGDRDALSTDAKYYVFDGMAALNTKSQAKKRRTEQGRDTYASGKIIFGAYKKQLIELILTKYGKLFYNVSPDYTSMILALNEARKCVMLFKSGIVHLNTDLSNGGRVDIDDTFALSYYNMLDEKEEVLANMLIPGLYCSTNNGITHDYLYLRKIYGLNYGFDKIAWLLYISEDIYRADRNWSSEQVGKEQISIFESFFNSLTEQEKVDFHAMKEARGQELASKDTQPVRTTGVKMRIRQLISKAVPAGILKQYRKLRGNRRPGYHASLERAIHANLN